MSEHFELPAELNIYSALETRDALLAWSAEHAPKAREFLEISAAQVAEVDGAGLQLLASLSNMGQSWLLRDPSERFSEACRTMGFGDWLKGRPIHATHGASK
jgi:ABC-type transporter Mla MlaB component